MRSISLCKLIFLLLGVFVFSCACDEDDDDGDNAKDDDVDDDDSADVGTDDDSADDDISDDDSTDDDAGELVFSEDIDDYPLGPLGDPWVLYLQGGDTSAEVISLDKASGNVIRIDGGDSEGDFIWFDYLFSATVQDMRISFEAFPHDGAYFRALVLTDAQEEVAQIDYGGLDSMLWGYDAADSWVDCLLELSDEQWLDLAFLLHPVEWTYDILLNDNTTECQGMAMNDAANQLFGGIRIGDLTFSDTGGLVDWDNFMGWRLSAF